ncbi:MAG: hypothetical protein AB7F64_09600 [Gammaproteobacteria bacterium]
MILSDTTLQALLDEAQVFVDYSAISSEDELLMELSQIAVILAHSIQLFKNYESLSLITVADIKLFMNYTKTQSTLKTAKELCDIAKGLAENLDQSLVQLNKSLAELNAVRTHKNQNQSKNDLHF